MDNPTSNQQGNQINQPPKPVQPTPTQPAPPPVPPLAPVNQPPPPQPAPPVASNPAPAPTSALQTPPAQAPMTSSKKSNTGLIVALVLVGLIVILGGGGYFGYRYLAGRVNSAITSTASTDNSSSDETNAYSKAKDNTPTDSLTIQVNADLKPIFENLYGGAKLDGYLANEGTTTSMSYVVKNKATSADYAKIEQALTEKGYTKKENITTSDGFVISFTKADVTISITFQSSLPYQFVVGADKTS